MTALDDIAAERKRQVEQEGWTAEHDDQHKPPTEPIIPGAEFEIAHPFIRDTYQGYDEDGPFTAKTWRPGVRLENVPPHGDTQTFADGSGTQIVTVVSTHKPGRFPERVFYTRKWRDPNGHEFGKGKLHSKTTPAFRRLIRGYRHGYVLADPALTTASRE